MVRSAKKIAKHDEDISTGEGDFKADTMILNTDLIGTQARSLVRTCSKIILSKNVVGRNGRSYWLAPRPASSKSLSMTELHALRGVQQSPTGQVGGGKVHSCQFHVTELARNFSLAL